MRRSIGEIMNTDVYTCNQSQTLGEVIEILVNREVGGLTIVDDDRHVVGFISDGNIMRSVSKQKTRSIYGGADSVMVLYDSESFEEKVAEFKNRNVMELATRKVYCVSPAHTVEEVAELLSKKKFKKVPIVEKDGTLVGIARRSTIMRYIFQLLFGAGQGDQGAGR